MRLWKRLYVWLILRSLNNCFSELATLKEKQINKDEEFEDIDDFEYDFWPHEMETRIIKAYKQIIVVNLHQRKIHKCYTEDMEKVSLGWTSHKFHHCELLSKNLCYKLWWIAARFYLLFLTKTFIPVWNRWICHRLWHYMLICISGGWM